MFHQNLKTGTILMSKATDSKLKVTKAPKTVSSETTLTVAEFDGTKVVRGTAKEIKADSLRRRYNIVTQ